MNPTPPSGPLWFRAKRYGWGWTPVTWQGWAVVAVYLLWTLFILEDSGHRSRTFFGGFAKFFPRGLLLTGLLIAVCYWKGEKPRWSWGRRPDDPETPSRDPHRDLPQ